MLDQELVAKMPKLGFGLMRLPRSDKEKDIIDTEQTSQMVDRFLDAGLTYFDSAYVYNGSEEAAKACLTSRHPRDSYFITSKINVNAKGVVDAEGAKAELAESLRREGVDYIDFYLLHALSKNNIKKYDDWGIWEFVKEAKEKGLTEVTCWGDGSPLREFMYVDDLANLCVFLMNNYSGNETVNAGTGKELTIKELTSLVAKVVGYTGKILWDTSKPNGTPRKLLDVSKAEKLGWKYKTELEDGIRMTYADFLNNPMRAES